MKTGKKDLKFYGMIVLLIRVKLWMTLSIFIPLTLILILLKFGLKPSLSMICGTMLASVNAIFWWGKLLGMEGWRCERCDNPVEKIDINRKEHTFTYKCRFCGQKRKYKRIGLK